jgi:uncharacterized protein YbaP (TraB family)
LRKRFQAAALAALLMLAPGTLAWPEEKSSAPAPVPAQPQPIECHGTDMMPELKAADPKAYARLERNGATAENGSAVLWRLERAGIPHSYVLGTVHLTDNRVTTLSEKVRSALEQSHAVILEAADLSPDATAHALAQATKATTYTDGRSLENMLRADEYEKVRAILSRAGVPTETARFYRPWVITMLIAASDCERRKIQAGELVLDMKIAAEAKARGIAVAGLETIEEQLTAMTSVPDSQQLGMLRANLKYADRTDDLVETMVRLYLDRRIGATWDFQLALAAQAGVGEASFAGFKQKLIVERNRKMRDGALPYLERGGAFIAVGALHLPGKTGLIALLREAGYTAVAIE